MNSAEIVEHEAFIREIKSDKIIVDVLSKSACISCQVKGMCSISDIENKDVELVRDLNRTYEVGQKVNVYLSRSKSLFAVFLGYFLPFLIVFLTLLISLQVTHKEGLSGLLSIAVLIPYYLILYVFRKKISKKYNFRLKD